MLNNRFRVRSRLRTLPPAEGGGGGLPTLVQSNVSWGEFSPLMATFTEFDPSPGSLVVLIAQAQSSSLGGSDPSTWVVEDNDANTYTYLGTYNGVGQNDGIQFAAWTAVVSVGGGSWWVTITNPDPELYLFIATLYEFTGFGATPFNAVGVTPDYNSAATANPVINITTTQDNCLVVGAFGTWWASPTGIGAGWSNLPDSTLADGTYFAYNYSFNGAALTAGAFTPNITYAAPSENIWGIAVAINGT